ncbi:phospholipase D-like domain-containing protein [Thermosipho atlanticus]|uniref:phospholipase D n=1 Tax=Thermosipho atlanticus DSM 15807 TaxID=1123380 RepID=A0A1M5RWH8_9BACT|nr:phospholipase D-like domain-containing protein [Thermosipho atlanticus]SHH30398.1 Phosphatidylserine/phosphatidylglycerophosphate/cardiolipin synthase [Thermosipho atlanticus DSM 15807]
MKIVKIVFLLIATISIGSQVYFTENGILTDVVAEFIKNSKSFLYISSYSLNEEKIVEVIKQVYNSGIDIKILLETPSPLLGDSVKMDYEKSLHHAKFIVNETGVLFGSANFTKSGLETGFNDVIFFENYVEQFRKLFLSLWNKGEVVGCQPFLVVGYDNVEEKILDFISHARKRIYVVVYAFTNKQIFTLLKYKESRGLDVRIITDSWFINSNLNEIPNRNLKIIFKPMLHHKFMIIDNMVILGSANFTLNGLNKNFEMIYITDDFLEEYLKIFEYLWRFESGNNNFKD